WSALSTSPFSWQTWQLQNAKIMIVTRRRHVRADGVPADAQVVRSASLALAEHFQDQGNGGQSADPDQGPAGCLALLRSQPIRQQEADANPQGNARPGNQANRGQLDMCFSHDGLLFFKNLTNPSQARRR